MISMPDETPQWAMNLASNMADGFAKMDKRMDALEGDVSRRIGGLEGRMTAAESRITNSDRPPSRHDLGQDAAIGSLVTDVAELKHDIGLIKTAVTGVLTNPKVLAAMRILFLLLAGYAATKGIRLLP
jgi:hypothetical protein